MTAVKDLAGEPMTSLAALSWTSCGAPDLSDRTGQPREVAGVAAQDAHKLAGGRVTLEPRISTYAIRSYLHEAMPRPEKPTMSMSQNEPARPERSLVRDGSAVHVPQDAPTDVRPMRPIQRLDCCATKARCR